MCLKPTAIELTILRAAWKGAVTADSAENGFAHIRAITGSKLGNTELAAAVAACVAGKKIHEPIRLPEGALQCHWTLELTAAGIDAVRDVMTCES